MIHNIPQPAFEQFVTNALGIDSKVQIRKGVVFVSLSTVRQHALSPMAPTIRLVTFRRLKTK
jgi:hypothetical protein